VIQHRLQLQPYLWLKVILHMPEGLPKVSTNNQPSILTLASVPAGGLTVGLGSDKRTGRFAGSEWECVPPSALFIAGDFLVAPDLVPGLQRLLYGKSWTAIFSLPEIARKYTERKA